VSLGRVVLVYTAAGVEDQTVQIYALDPGVYEEYI